MSTETHPAAADAARHGDHFAAAAADAAQHGHDGHGHDDHGHGDGAAHGSRRGYLIGFALSVLLTAIPFAAVMGGWFADPRIAAGLCMAFALAQIVVHMIFFLHMNTKSEHGWTIMALIFTIIIVVIALTGSLWVMYHMNQNMMPGMEMSGPM